MVGSAVVLQGLRRSTLRPVARELCHGLLSLAPAALALRGGELAAYHGAEHISIGTLRARRVAAEGARALRLAPRRPDAAHDRGRQPARRAGAERLRVRRALGGAVGALAASTEIFGWMTRHPDAPARRGRSPSPATSCSTGSARASRPPAQLEVAEAALRACLELER